MKFTGSRPDRPRRMRGIQPDFAPVGGMSLEQAGRLRDLKDRARVGGMPYAVFVDLIRRVGLNKTSGDIDGRLAMLEELVEKELAPKKRGGLR